MYCCVMHKSLMSNVVNDQLCFVFCTTTVRALLPLLDICISYCYCLTEDQHVNVVSAKLGIRKKIRNYNSHSITIIKFAKF
jgi:hypothetical protein